MNARWLVGGGLQRRLLWTVLAGAVLFSAIVGALGYEWAYRRAVQTSVATLEGVAGAVERTLAIGAFAADAVLMQEVVDGLARQELAASVQVHSRAGTLRARGRGAAHGASDVAAVMVQRRLVSPFDPRETVATLTIIADGARLAAAAKREAAALGALMAAQAMMLAALLYVAAAHLVSQPIVRLAQQLRRMSPGTAQRLQRPPRHAGDEIGVLIDGANALIEANAVALERERGLHAEIAAMEAQYRRIFESSSAGIFVLDRDGHLINSNPTVSRVVGMSPEQLRRLAREDFITPVFCEPERVREMITKARDHDETVSADLELARGGDQRRWVHCLLSVQPSRRDEGAAAADAAAQPQAAIDAVEGVIYDITDRKSVERAARYQMLHDPLTGLWNRAGTVSGGARRIAEARRCGSALSLMCVDLDGFKAINDGHGHGGGDEVLATCARRMQAALRSGSDLVGRLGGDEFMIVLPGLDVGDPVLAQIAAQVLAAVGEPIDLSSGPTVCVGVCIGISSLGRHGADLQTLTEAADRAMYAVKAGGKNGFACALGVPATPAGRALAAGGVPRPTAAKAGHAEEGAAERSPLVFLDTLI